MKTLSVLLLTSLLLQAALAAPDEAIGRVVSVLSGDSFGIEVVSGDSRVHGIDRVRLADIDSPSTLTAEGKAAKKYTASILRNKTVYLDIDDNTPGGRNDLGLLVCVAYLMDSSSRPVWPPVNRIIVDAGQAVVNDDKKNEFNASAWWQAPPEMRVTRALPAAKDSKSTFPAAKVLEKDPNSSLISIGYRRG